ncbi:hypothetical protein ES708_33449 [subsurface metagenome]
MRGNVVRQVGYHLIAPPPHQLLRLDFEHIAIDDGDVIKRSQRLFKQSRQLVIQLDGNHPTRSLGQLPGEDAQPRPHLHHQVVGAELGGGDNGFQHFGINKEVLPQPLSRPEV